MAKNTTEEIGRVLEAYFTKWAALVNSRHDKAFFEELHPTAVGWKVADRAEHDRLVGELRDACDLVVGAWMNERWITKLHLKDMTLSHGIEVIKVMERRPDSSDVVGLDHVDFYSPAVTQADHVLEGEPDLKWTREENKAKWISIWFDGGEAKLRTDTVLDSYIRDLRAARNAILKKTL